MKRPQRLPALSLILLAFLAVSGCGEVGKPQPTLTVTPQPVASPSVAPSALPSPRESTAPQLEKVDPRNGGAEALEHDIVVKLEPANNFLDATDTITFDGRGSATAPIVLVFATSLKIVNILDGRTHEILPFRPVEIDGLDAWYRAVAFSFTAGGSGKPRAIINYFGKINDPLQSSDSLRFVVGDRTRGIISSEGIYLSGGTGWYPDTWRSMATYRVEMKVPVQYDTIAPGNLVKRERGEAETVTVYENLLPADGLDVVGGVYSKATKTTKAGVTVETFFHPDDQALAEPYLEAACEYIDAYSDLLGKYPYNRFSIVSNFFPTGYGMPAFTLLGRQVIQRMHTQEYALGHEVVHNWWGNGVFVDWEKGNWCEGLTTYCANYYWLEMKNGEGSDPVVEYRRRSLQRYRVKIDEDNDYPVRGFRSKTEDADNEIGYTKAMMFFHQLRIKVGDKNFWTAVRKFYAAYLGKRATWGDIQLVMEKESGTQLGAFFAQWLDRKGLPELSVSDVRTDLGTEGASVVFTITQTAPLWEVFVEVVVELKNRTHREVVSLNEASRTFRLHLPEEPISLTVDPDAHLMRKLKDDEIRPCLNKTVSFKRPVVVVIPDSTEGSTRFEQLAGRVASQSKGTVATFTSFDPTAAVTSDLLLVGPIEKTSALVKDQSLFHIEVSEFIRRKLASYTGNMVQNPTDVCFLASFDTQNGGTVTFYSWFGENPPPAHLDRIIFFYGWDGFVLFKNGRKLAQGSLPSKGTPLSARLKVATAPPVEKLKLADGVDEAEAKLIAEKLTGLSFMGRCAGTEGGKAAGDYLASLLADAGIQGGAPAGGYFQDFSFAVRDIKECKVEWDSTTAPKAPQIGKLAANASDRGASGFVQTMPLVFGAGGSVSRPALIAGNGVRSKTANLDAYKDLDTDAVRGRVFVISYSPQSEFPELSDEQKYHMRNELSPYGRAQAAQELGASAVVFIANPVSFTKKHGDLVTFASVWPSGPPDDPWHNLPDRQPMEQRIEIASKQARSLESGPRLEIPVLVVFGDPSLIAGAVFTEESFVIRASVTVEEQQIVTRNVIGVIPGSDPVKSLDAVVLCAHYDHLGPAMKVPGKYMSGANDNASGVVALLAAATKIRIAQPKRKVIVLFTGAEEWGFRGAWAYLRDPAHPRSRTLAVLNFDMVGRSEDGLFLMGYEHNPKLAEVVGLAAEKRGVALGKGPEHALMGGDNWPFHCKGIPTLLMSSGRFEEYHSTQDTADLLSYDSIMKAGEVWAEAVMLLDEVEALPNPEDKWTPFPTRK